MNEVFETLHAQTYKKKDGEKSEDGTNVLFATVQPEKWPSLMKRFNISTVPTFLFFSNNRLVRNTCGANAVLLSQNVKWLTEQSESELLDGACEVVSTLGEITLVMKGSADEPKCGFSRQAVDVLRKAGVHFTTFDVLSDEEVRAGLKKRFTWPTFPMLFARGRLVGGIDIVRQLADEGTLVEELGRDERQDVGEKSGQKQEGEAPPSGAESKQDVAPKAQNTGANEDGEEQGEQGVSSALRARLEGLVQQRDVMLFMKGSPSTPRCGFSRKIVEILKNEKIEFGHFDILEDNEVRQGLKKLFEWQTYPQLYSKGQLVGGLDIVKELVQMGELKKEVCR